MKQKVVARSVAALACGLLAVTAAAANGSVYSHPTVVSATAVTNTPHLVPTAAVAHPASYAIAEAGNQMVVVGNFDTIENSQRNTQFARSNVFAFDKLTGASATSLRRSTVRSGRSCPTAPRSGSAAASRP